MASVNCFEDLHVWQKAVEFVKEVYLVTDRPGLQKDFGLKDQIRRAAVSIPSNIAEGFERRSRKEYLNFLNFAKASAGEVRCQIYIAHEIGYLTKDEHDRLREMARFLGGSIMNHMKSIARTAN